MRNLAEHRKKREIAEKVGYTSLDQTDWGISFEDLEVTHHNQKAIEALTRWSPEETRKGAVLYGSVGSGKSTLCKALINRWASPTFRCVFISMTKLMQEFKDAIEDPETSVGEIENRVITADLLILDDLSAGKITDWEREKVFNIVNERYQKKRPMIVTTNSTPDDLLKIYGRRTHDRLTEICRWFLLDGPSFRKINAVDSW